MKQRKKRHSCLANRSLETAGPEAAADAAVAADENLSGVSVVREGVFALEGHRLGKKKKGATQKGPGNKHQCLRSLAAHAFLRHNTAGLQGAAAPEALFWSQSGQNNGDR